MRSGAVIVLVWYFIACWPCAAASAELGPGSRGSSPPLRRLSSAAAGAECTSNAGCASGVCAGGVCCPDYITPGSCEACMPKPPDGSRLGCDECAAGYYEHEWRCYRMGPWQDLPAGHACTRGSQCSSGTCIGTCCLPGIDLNSCGGCGLAGECSWCASACAYDGCNDDDPLDVRCTACDRLYVLQGSGCAPFMTGGVMVTVSWVAAIVLALVIVALAVACTYNESEASKVPYNRCTGALRVVWGLRGVTLGTLDVITDAAAIVQYLLQDSTWPWLLSWAFLNGAAGSNIFSLRLYVAHAERAPTQILTKPALAERGNTICFGAFFLSLGVGVALLTVV